MYGTNVCTTTFVHVSTHIDFMCTYRYINIEYRYVCVILNYTLIYMQMHMDRFIRHAYLAQIANPFFLSRSWTSMNMFSFIDRYLDRLWDMRSEHLAMGVTIPVTVHAELFKWFRAKCTVRLFSGCSECTLRTVSPATGLCGIFQIYVGNYEMIGPSKRRREKPASFSYETRNWLLAMAPSRSSCWISSSPVRCN